MSLDNVSWNLWQEATAEWKTLMNDCELEFADIIGLNSVFFGLDQTDVYGI